MDSRESEDGRLLARYQKGEAEALKLLYLRLAPTVRAFLLSKVRRRDRLDDLDQEVWTRVAEHAPRFLFKSAVGTWVMGIAHNVLKEDRRDREKQPIAFSQMEEDSGDARPDQVRDGRATAPEQVVQKERDQALHGAIDALPDDERSAFILHASFGHPFPEVASILGVSLITAKRWYAAAIVTLGKALEAWRPEGRSRSREKE
jgi:RNA polymerase sigma-70 factor, ECF subfamily